MESVTASGLVLSQRSLIPGSDPVMPNANDPADHPPASVGPPAATSGDPHGLNVVSVGEPAPWPRGVPPVVPWSGWPAEWATPLWSRGAGLSELSHTAWACVDLNSRVFATMPPYLVGAADSLNSDWINNPDPDRYNSWWEFARELLWDYQDCGEAFVVSTAEYSTGWPARFHVVSPQLVEVDIVGGLRRYTIGGLPVPRGEILHVGYLMRSTEARGHGPLEAGRHLIAASQTLWRYASNVVAGGGLPTGTLTHPEELTAAQSSDLQSQWVAGAMTNPGLPRVLSGGVEFNAQSFSPEQLTLVDLTRWVESRIAVLLGVPPFLQGLPSGGDSMTYSNVQQLFEYHWRAALSTFAAHLMSALSGWLLPRGTTVEVNRDEYVKPGALERAQAWDIYNRLGLSWGQIAEAERFQVAAPSATLSSGVLQ